MASKMSPAYLIGLVFGVAILVGTVGYSLVAQPMARDAAGCLAGQQLTSSIALVIDATDPLTPIHRARLERAVEDLLRLAPDGAKAMVLAIQPEEAPREAFARCNPGASGNELTENVAKLQARYRTTFADPLRTAVSGLAGAAGSTRSPLIEALTTTTQRPDFDRRVASRTLIIASDMLQNTPSYSHYRGDFGQRFRLSSLAVGDQADFAGVEVIVDYFSRSEHRHRQGPRHRAFWESWFKERGARSVRFLGVANRGPTS